MKGSCPYSKPLAVIIFKADFDICTGNLFLKTIKY